MMMVFALYHGLSCLSTQGHPSSCPPGAGEMVECGGKTGLSRATKGQCVWEACLLVERELVSEWREAELGFVTAGDSSRS